MFRIRIRIPSSIVMAAALVVNGLVTPGVALAQTSASETARATDLFKSGKAAFAKGDMAEAERLFAQAFAIRKSSDIAANLAQSQLEQEKYRSAAENFSWALANLLPSATDAQRKAVETGLGRARAEVAVLRLDIEPHGADVLVGAHNAGKSPIESGVFVDPGEVIISVRHDGFVAVDKRVMAGKGTEQAVDITLSPREASPPTAAVPAASSSASRQASFSASDRAEPKSLVPAFIATGVAVVGGVAGLVFTLGASSKENDADALAARLEDTYGADACKGRAPGSECDELTNARESVDSSRNLAVGAFVIGGVAAVAAGYFYWDALSQRSSGSAQRKRPRFGLMPALDVAPAERAAAIGSVKLGVSGTF